MSGKHAGLSGLVAAILDSFGINFPAVEEVINGMGLRRDTEEYIQSLANFDRGTPVSMVQARKALAGRVGPYQTPYRPLSGRFKSTVRRIPAYDTISGVDSGEVLIPSGRKPRARRDSA